MTVRQLIEKYHIKYAQICNCEDVTFRGVIIHQNVLVKDFVYDKEDNDIYIWI